MLEIEFTVRKDTTVTLMLSKMLAPRWFLEGTGLRPGQWVVILDDDGSIHDVW